MNYAQLLLKMTSLEVMQSERSVVLVFYLNGDISLTQYHYIIANMSSISSCSSTITVDEKKQKEPSFTDNSSIVYSDTITTNSTIST